VENAIQGLSQLTNDILIENNVFYKDVIDAVLRQPQDETHIPYANHTVPGVVYLSDYDLGSNGIAYYDVDYANYTLSTGEDFQPWNSGWTYRNDGVDIQTNSDTSNSNGYHVGYTNNNEWMKYTLNVSETGFYNLKLRYATPQSGAKIKFYMDDVDIAGNVSLGNSGGWTNFVNHFIYNSYIEAGTHVFKVKVDGNTEFNMGSVEFINSTDQIPNFDVLSAITNDDEQSLTIVFNHPITNQSLSNDLFQVKVNNNIRTIESVEVNSENNRSVIINLSEYLFYQDQIKVSYDGSIITSVYNSTLDSFEDLLVDNNLQTRFLIPSKIQAEDFNYQYGLQTENTSDIGGGLNIGYTDAGDYADYLVYISDSGNYNLNLRTAAAYNSGKVEFLLLNNNSTASISTVDLPVTGGWQSWQTTTTETTLNAGVYSLKMKVLESGFNINWFEFEFLNSLSVDSQIKTITSIYPNPIDQNFKIQFNDNQEVKVLKIIDINGRLVKQLNPNEINQYNISDLKSGVYILIIETNELQYQKKLIKN